MNNIDYIKLGKLATAKGGSGFPEIYQGRNIGIPFIKVSDMNLLGNERFINTSNNYLERDLIKRLNITVFPRNSIVFAKVGAALLLNRRRLLATETAIDNNMMAVMCHGVDVGFLYHYLTSVDFEIFVQPGAVPSINQKHIHDLDIPKFTLPEQQKIAEILTAADEQIELTEKLIEKKELIKRGLMSDLFTAISSIPKRNLVDFCKPRQHQTLSQEQLTGGKYKVFGANGYIGFHNTYTHDAPVIAVTCRGSTCGTINYLDAYTYITGNSMCLDDLDESICTKEYLYQYLTFRGLRDLITGSAQPQIIGAAFSSVEVPIPALDVQLRISKCLFLAANEINHQRQTLSKLKKQKQGLMQDLLTGRVRVN
jgi:restriction endonuclease S subunit